MNKGQSLYKKTQIYRKSDVPPPKREPDVIRALDNDHNIVEVRTEHNGKVTVTQEYNKPKLKAKTKPRPTPQTVTIQVQNKLGGEARIAAWNANKIPYTVDNALLNAVTDAGGEVSMTLRCKKNTPILIRGRALRGGKMVGPVAEQIYRSTNDDDDVKFIIQ